MEVLGTSFGLGAPWKKKNCWDTKCTVNRESLENARSNYGALGAAANLTGG